MKPLQKMKNLVDSWLAEKKNFPAIMAEALDCRLFTLQELADGLKVDISILSGWRYGRSLPGEEQQATVIAIILTHFATES